MLFSFAVGLQFWRDCLNRELFFKIQLNLDPRTILFQVYDLNKMNVLSILLHIEVLEPFSISHVSTTSLTWLVTEYSIFGGMFLLFNRHWLEYLLSTRGYS
jgi:hypothetical protein